jgi:hypothetical protein
LILALISKGNRRVLRCDFLLSLESDSTESTHAHDQLSFEKRDPLEKKTHDHLVRVGPAGVGRDQSGGAALAVPGKAAALRGAAHGQGEDARRVAVAVAVVAVIAAVARRPHVDRTFTTSPLNYFVKYDDFGNISCVTY